jgi:hypothetical protein
MIADEIIAIQPSPFAVGLLHLVKRRNPLWRPVSMATTWRFVVRMVAHGTGSRWLLVPRRHVRVMPPPEAQSEIPALN